MAKNCIKVLLEIKRRYCSHSYGSDTVLKQSEPTVQLLTHHQTSSLQLCGQTTVLTSRFGGSYRSVCTAIMLKSDIVCWSYETVYRGYMSEYDTGRQTDGQTDKSINGC